MGFLVVERAGRARLPPLGCPAGVRYAWRRDMYADTAMCPGCHATSMVRFGRELLKCRTCGLAYCPEMPDPERVADLYGEDYFHGDEYFDYVQQRPALEANFRRRLRSIEPYLIKTAGLVELGCAYGFFLALAKDEVAWHAGFDVSQVAVDYATSALGVNASTQDFLKWRPSEPVGTVVMWDFIEHVATPEEFLKSASSVLRVGGHVVLTTGDIRALVPRVRGLRWRMIHPPTHLYYFTVPSMRVMMERHGLRIVHVSHPAVWRNARAMMEQVVQIRGDGALAALGRKITGLGIADRIDVPLNLWDIMEVVAVKIR